MNVKNRTLFIADNLNIMRGIDSESIDLIYLDPPFNTNKQHKAPIGSKAEGAEFKDIWTDDDIKYEWLGEIAEQNEDLYQIIQASETTYNKSMRIYLTAMAIRLFEMQRILKPTGSIYLHCDPTASHYLKLVMDKLFGNKNFRAEIIWKRHNAHNDKLYGTIHDTIFYYSQSDKGIPDDVRVPLSKKRLKNYRYSDDRGKYSIGDLTGSETRNGESGQPWRDFNPTAHKRHWAVAKTGKYADYIEQNFIPNYRAIKSIHERLDILEKNRFIHWTQNGTPQLKRYLIPDAGSPPQSIWEDIPAVKGVEKTGYPTQKPLALLHRIIKASSNEGNIVLDPFCGCATACVAAEQLDRQWIGIDISPDAEIITKIRLQEEVDNKVDLFNPYQDVYIESSLPQRTDLGERANQIHLPQAHVHKRTLFGQQEGRCNGCRYSLPFQNLTIDHIIPQTKGGTDAITNLQLLCNHCNSVKGNRTHQELVSSLREKGILY